MSQDLALGRSRPPCGRLSAREAALATPLLALCFLAVYDAVLCVESRSRLSNAAQAIARSLAADGDPMRADMSKLLSEAARLAAPADVAGGGGLVLSLVAGSGTADPVVVWQRRAGPAPSAAVAQPFASAADPPSIDGRPLQLEADLTAPPDPWVIGAPLLAAWFGEWSRGTARVAIDPRNARDVR